MHEVALPIEDLIKDKSLPKFNWNFLKPEKCFLYGGNPLGRPIRI